MLRPPRVRRSQAGGCGCGGTAIQQANQQAGTEQGALAASAAIQADPSNDASPVRVLSPGSDGSVSQSNNAASSAHSGNGAATTQNANQSQAGESCGCSDGLGIRCSDRRPRPSSRRPPHCRRLCRSSATTTRAVGAVARRQAITPRRFGSGARARTAALISPTTPIPRRPLGNRAATTQDGTQSESGSGIQVLGQQAETAQDALSQPPWQRSSVRPTPPRRFGSGARAAAVPSHRPTTQPPQRRPGNDASTGQSGRQSIAGNRCGCAQLPIQVAGQWAGTAQLAPAFSAALQAWPSNNASGTDVRSPGTAGSLAQTNGAGSRGDAANGARSTEGVSQAA